MQSIHKTTSSSKGSAVLTAETSVSNSPRSLLELLQDPPLLLITLNFDLLKRAAKRLNLTDDQLVKYHQILAEIEETITEINTNVVYENEEQAIELSAAAAAGKADSLYIPTISSLLEKLNDLLSQLDVLATFKNRPLITAIKDRIKRSYKLLNREVQKHLRNNAIERKEIQWQTHAFYTEQNLIAQDAEQHAALETLLSDLSKLFTFDDKTPQCFMSYAWPTAEHRSQEIWVPLFLKTLRAHLRSAGIHALLDIEDNIGDDHKEDFCQGAKDSEFALVYCTPSLKDRIDALNYSSVQLELNLIKDKHQQDRTVINQSRVIYMLGAGHEHESLPEEWVDRELIFNWREKSYTKSLKAFLRSLYVSYYPESSEDHKAQWTQFNAKWEAYYAAHPDRTKPLTSEQVQAQLSNPTLASRIADLEDAVSKESQLQAYYRKRIEEADALLSTPLYQLPQRNRNFTGRASQLDQIARQLESNPVGVITQSVAGLGGVGKSSLVLEYAHTARMTAGNEAGAAGAAGVREVGYDYIVWLSAREPLSAFSDFAQDVLGIDTQAYKDDHATLMRQIYIRLSQAYPNVLLVLDDVSNKDKVEHFLPKERYGDGKLHILLTSRSAHWIGHAVIELDVFDPADARSYILKLLNPEGQTPTETPESADELAKALGYFPLALTQAVAYIQQTGCGIAGYLTRYETTYDNKAKLLQIPSQQTPAALAQHAHQKMVYTTWYLSIESLRVILPAAENLLNICAFYAPDPIPNRVIDRAFSKDDFGFNKILRGLRDYCLIAVEVQESIQIHQLLQEVIRLHVGEKKGQEDTAENNVVVEALKLLDKAFLYDKESGEENKLATWQYNKGLLTHIHSFQNYMMYFSNSRQADLVRLLHSAACLYGDLGKYLDQKILLEFVLSFRKKDTHNVDKKDIAVTRLNLGNAYNALGSSKKSVKQIEKALYAIKDLYGDENYRVAVVLNNLGNVYQTLGNTVESHRSYMSADQIISKEINVTLEEERMFIKMGLANSYFFIGKHTLAIDLLENVSASLSEHFGSDHPDYLTCLVSLAIAYGGVGEQNKKIKILETVLPRLKEYYGTEHFKVAQVTFELGNTFFYSRKIKDSIRFYNDALKVFENWFGSDHIEVAKVKMNLSQCFLLTEDFEASKGMMLDVLSVYESYYGKDHPKVAELLMNMSALYDQDIVKQRILLERSLYIFSENFEYNSLNFSKNLYKLAENFLRRDNYLSAIEYAKCALKLFTSYGGDMMFIQITRDFLIRCQQKITTTPFKISLEAMQSDQDGNTLLSKILSFAHESTIKSVLDSIDELPDLETRSVCLAIASGDITDDTLEGAYKYNKIFMKVAPLSSQFKHNFAICCSLKDEWENANRYFLEALTLKRSTSTLTEYANFLIQRREVLAAQGITESAEHYLKEARSLQDNAGLGYSQMEAPALDSVLSTELKHAGGQITLTPWAMATWLLINLYHETDKNDLAIALLEEFKAYVLSHQDDRMAHVLSAHAASLVKDFDYAKALLTEIDYPSDALLDKIPGSRELIAEATTSAARVVETPGEATELTPTVSPDFYAFLQTQKLLPQDMAYDHFEEHFASHAKRAEVQEAYQAFMAVQVSGVSAAGVGSLVTAPPAYTQSDAPASLTGLAQSSTAAVTASPATVGLFGTSQPASHLAMLLLQTQKQIPEPGQVQLIFKTAREAEDCQRQLQAAMQSASAAAAAASSTSDYAIETITLIDEEKAGASAASTAAAVQENYAITLTRADYNRILEDPNAYDELLETFRMVQAHRI